MFQPNLSEKISVMQIFGMMLAFFALYFIVNPEKNSKIPDIKKGDLIIVKEVDPSEIEVGTVISFYAAEDNYTTIWTHKVIEVIEENGEVKFRTQEDNAFPPSEEYQVTSLLPSVLST